MTQMVELEDVLATIDKVANFGDYARSELTANYGQPRFDLFHDIMRAILAMRTVEPDVIAPPECSCDDPECLARHEPLTLRQAYDNCLERLGQAEGTLRAMHRSECIDRGECWECGKPFEQCECPNKAEEANKE